MSSFVPKCRQPVADAVGAERALVDLLRPLVKFRDVEGAARDAVAAADAVLLLEVHDAVRVLNNRAVGRAGDEAAGLGAVHALGFAHEPHQRARVLVLDELDEVPVVPVGRGHRLVRVVEGRLAERVVVPLDAGHLASLAADAGRHVYVLADLDGALRAASGDGAGVGRDALYLVGSYVGHALPSPQAFSNFTRKPLNSGV